jgi:hypothetical protein
MVDACGGFRGQEVATRCLEELEGCIVMDKALRANL